LRIASTKARKFHKTFMKDYKDRRGVMPGLSDDGRPQGSEEVLEASQEAIYAFEDFVRKMLTGREIDDLLKFENLEVIKSTLSRLSNLYATGIFRATPPPFDKSKRIWRYGLAPLREDEKRLFVDFWLERLFARAVELGPCPGHIRDCVVIDEAKIYFAAKDPDHIINRLIREARKFGLMLIFANQHATEYPEGILAGVGTKILLQVDKLYYRHTESMTGVPRDSLDWLHKNPRSTMMYESKTISSAYGQDGQWTWTCIPPHMQDVATGQCAIEALFASTFRSGAFSAPTTTGGAPGNPAQIGNGQRGGRAPQAGNFGERPSPPRREPQVPPDHGETDFRNDDAGPGHYHGMDEHQHQFEPAATVAGGAPVGDDGW
jgi:hypothetical protein